MLINHIFPKNCQVTLKFSDGMTYQGILITLDEDSISILSGERRFTFDSQSLKLLSSIMVQVPVIEKVVRPIMVHSNATIDTFNGIVGNIREGSRSWQIKKSCFLDSNLKKLSEEEPGKLIGKDVICGWQSIPVKGCAPRFAIKELCSLDDMLDSISELAKKGYLWEAKGLIDVLSFQFPQDEDVIRFKQVLDPILPPVGVVNLNEDFSRESEEHLIAMGRITKVDMSSGKGEIYDQKSHLPLFFHRNQLLEQELYEQEDFLLIGTPVLYFIKRAKFKGGYEARSIIRPIPLENALILADDLFDYEKLNVWGLLNVLHGQFPNNEEIIEGIARCEEDYYVHDNKWTAVTLPIFTGYNQPKLIDIHIAKKTVNLIRENKHEELITINSIPRENENIEVFQAVDTSSTKSAKYAANGKNNIIDPKQEGEKISVNEANQEQPAVLVPEISSKEDEKKKIVVNTNKSNKSNSSKKDGKKTSFSFKAGSLGEGMFALAEKFNLEEPEDELMPVQEKIVIEPIAKVLSYSDGYGFVQSLDEDKTVFSFTLKDIIDPGLLNKAESRWSRDGIKNTLVSCIINKDINHALFVARPRFVTIREVRNRESSYDYETAQGLLDIILNQYPNNVEALDLVNELQRLTTTPSEHFKASSDSLSPSGTILSLPNNHHGVGRIKDARITKKIKYTIDDIVDEEYKSKFLRIGDELIYSLEEVPGEKAYHARFIHRALPLVQLITMARSLLTNHKLQEAWGIAMNILDRDPLNQEGLEIKSFCESDSSFIPIIRVGASQELKLAETLLKNAEYEAAIEKYKIAYDASIETDKCIRQIIETYRRYLHSLKSERKDISQVESRYYSFSEDYILKLSENNIENLRCKLNYYRDRKDSGAIINVYNAQAALLAHGKEDHDEEIAVIYANIAKEILTSQLYGREHMCTQYVERSLRLDPGCDLAIACRVVLNMRKSKKNVFLPKSMFPPYNIEPFLKESQERVNKTRQSSFEKERMKLFKSIINLSYQNGNDNEILKLLYYYLSTFTQVNLEAYHRIVSEENKRTDPIDFLISQRLSEYIEPNSKIWPEFQLLSAFSPTVSMLLSNLLYEIDSETVFDVFRANGISVRNNATRKVYGTNFERWRDQCFQKYDLLRNYCLQLSEQSDVIDFIHFVDSIDVSKWTITADSNMIGSLVDSLSPIMKDFINANTSLGIQRISKEIYTIILDLIERIKSQPTIFLTVIITPFLETLRLCVNRIVKEKHFLEPNPKVSVVSCSTVSQSGDLLVEIELLNDGSMSLPISQPCISICDSAYITPLKAEPFTKYGEIYGGNSDVFTMNVRVNSTGNTDVELLILLSYFVDTQKRTSRMNLPLTIPDKYIDWTGKNPYVGYGAKAENEKMFFGRDSFIDKVKGAIIPEYENCYLSQLPCHFLIFGQKRCGKSSVLFHLKKKLELTGRVFCAETSFLDIKNEEDCYYNLLMAIQVQLDNMREEAELAILDGIENIDVPDFSLPTEIQQQTIPIDFNTFKLYLRKFKSSLKRCKRFSSHQFVFLIDEFTSVHNSIRGGYIDHVFMEHWKTLQEDSSVNFAAVLIGQDVMPSFLKEYGNNNVFAIFHPERLTYLDPFFAKKLIEEPIVSVSKDVSIFIGSSVDRILYYTACSTYYTMIFCNQLLDYLTEKRLSKITVEDVEETAKRVVSSDLFGSTCFDALVKAGESDLVSEFSQQQVEWILSQIARAESNNSRGCLRSQIQTNEDLGIDNESFIDAILEDLQERKVIDIENNYYTIKVKLYVKWIKNRL